MNYAERLENVTVLGASGKMGSGILLLTAMEMADLSLKPENKDRQFVLNAVDVSNKALDGLMKYLKVQVQKAAEKKIVQLRKVYENNADLIDNKDIVDRYVADVCAIVRPTVVLESAYASGLVFEAVIENPALKIKLLSQINKNSANAPWFFTNTSSIPVHELDEKAGLGGRLLGVHFYNPPAIQKLVELIRAASTKDELVEFALAYSKNLRKIVVPSNDFAGFIGNGHFMRDALHGIAEAERLSKEMPFAEAVYMVNRATQDFLIRPMGIFQLIDYVGLDVCQYIMSVMAERFPGETIHSPLLDRLIAAGVKGGQFSDGSQKDGFFKYEKNRPAAIYDPEAKQYVPVASFQAACDAKMGPLPQPALSWKSAVKHPKKEAALEEFFAKLAAMSSPGAVLAMRYGERSREIGLKLVSDKVAQKEEDVNTVLLSGFYHVYGPINNYFKREMVK
ncbi:MAG: 3-hydroxyacyl-CoA dehydrogenase family protein [Elusimicrobiales bacterium]|nr:3-hydroxyacyl-CoA dehydrogenase family protein [Elusimicrobiales bacterium]